MRACCGIAVAALALFSTVGDAAAQTADELLGAEGANVEEDSVEEDSVAGATGDDGAAAEEDEGVDPDTDPKEQRRESYYFLGLRFRNYIAPQFILNLFVDGAATINVFSFGPELTTRRNGLEIDFALSYVDFSFDPMLFKGKDDPVVKYEEVSSSMKMIQATVDFLFEAYTSEDSRFSFLFGGGVGLGVVFGDLRQNQIHPVDPANPDTDNLGQWRRCRGADDPDVRDPGSGSRYCDDSNDHYGDYDQPSWANGGSKPLIFPYLAFPQLSFRYKPIKQLQTRADLGFALSNGFFFGMNAAYGF